MDKKERSHLGRKIILMVSRDDLKAYLPTDMERDWVKEKDKNLLIKTTPDQLPALFSELRPQGFGGGVSQNKYWILFYNKIFTGTLFSDSAFDRAVIHARSIGVDVDRLKDFKNKIMTIRKLVG